jgi:hypothetical protein
MPSQPEMVATLEQQRTGYGSPCKVSVDRLLHGRAPRAPRDVADGPSDEKHSEHDEAEVLQINRETCKVPLHKELLRVPLPFELQILKRDTLPGPLRTYQCPRIASGNAIRGAVEVKVTGLEKIRRVLHFKAESSSWFAPLLSERSVPRPRRCR